MVYALFLLTLTTIKKHRNENFHDKADSESATSCKKREIDTESEHI